MLKSAAGAGSGRADEHRAHADLPGRREVARQIVEEDRPAGSTPSRSSTVR